MNFLAFWITAMVIVGSTLAEEEIAQNQVLNDEVSGRGCYDCHGGSDHIDDLDHTAIHQYSGQGVDLSWLWGMGGVALSILPILAVNIVGVVLLAILLKHIGHDSGPAPSYQPAYYSTYQGYDAGGAAGYAASAPPTGGAGGYHKRSTVQARNFVPDHSTLQFLTSLIGDAITKYSKLEAAEE